ncbi:MAG: MBL fold metallo-hydrolase [Bacteroidales bacterium]|jgi:glyoxylase-like metal-dependent hydrolase (beta-lactamase superfamily II)|nr:MBL fold metallo-hydrolase [Bacteroidales bacterium]
MKNTVLILISVILIASVFVACAQKNNKSGLTSYQVGANTLYLLSEGNKAGNSSILIGATPEMKKATIPNDTFPMGTNAFLLRTPHKNILIDAGYGINLAQNLNAVGVTSAQIDIILLTHLHGDHIGGLLKDNKVVFPNAELYIAQPEYDYWMSDVAMNTLPETQRGSFVKAREVIAAYQTHLHLFNPAELGENATAIVEDIVAFGAYGHTPGHTVYLITSNNEKLMVWGDLTHAMAIQMPYPQVAVTYDVNPEMAVISREKVLQYVEQQHIAVAGMHIASPAIGMLEKSATGYKFVTK